MTDPIPLFRRVVVTKSQIYKLARISKAGPGSRSEGPAPSSLSDWGFPPAQDMSCQPSIDSRSASIRWLTAGIGRVCLRLGG